MYGPRRLIVGGQSDETSIAGPDDVVMARRGRKRGNAFTIPAFAVEIVIVVQGIEKLVFSALPYAFFISGNSQVLIIISPWILSVLQLEVIQRFRQYVIGQLI